MIHVENMEVEEHCFCSEAELVSPIIIIIIIILDKGKCKRPLFLSTGNTVYGKTYLRKYTDIILCKSDLECYKKKALKMRTSQYVWQMLSQVKIGLEILVG